VDHEATPHLAWDFESTIADTFESLLDQPFSQANLAYVPTAANVELGDKGWLIDRLAEMKALDFRQVDIVDISALSKDQWLPRLEEANVVTFGGGCTPHLLDWLARSGLSEMQYLWGNACLRGDQRADNIRARADGVPNVYALDDQCALSVIDGKIEVVGEGEHLTL
jgi:hypothetical protein